MRRIVVVEAPGIHVDTVLGSLGAAGFEAVRATTTDDARRQVEAGAVGIVVAREAEGVARTLGTLPPTVRRGCLLLLIGAREQKPSGLDAFLAGADLVLGSNECARIGEVTAAALAAKRSLVAALDPAAAARLGG